MAIEAPHRRFTVQDYHKMAEAGILCEDDRVELIDGEIVETSTQNPIRLGQHSEPQPDVAVVCFRTDFYSGSTAIPQDVLLG